MVHAHGGADLDLPRTAERVVAVVVVVLAVLTVAGVVMLWPDGEIDSRAAAVGIQTERVAAEVVAADVDFCSFIGGGQGDECLVVTIRPLQGRDAGREIPLGEFAVADPFTPDLHAGEEIIVGVERGDRYTLLSPGEAAVDGERVRLRVTDLDVAACSVPIPEAVACVAVQGVPDGGPDAGRELFIGEFDTADAAAAELVEGATVDAAVVEQDDFYFFADQQRRTALLWLAVLFAIAVVALGRLRGVAALAALALTTVILLRFTIPAILDGSAPLLVAVVSAAAIAFLALYTTHGPRTMTSVALLGTLASLGLTLLLGVVFFEVANFSGAISEEAVYVPLVADQVDIRGLLLAGVIIGALGALDDMTITQAATVWQLHSADPDVGRRRLFSGGLQVGREHVGSTVNTLLLAYAGASMPLLLLFVLSDQSLGTVANTEVVAVEIVRTLVGSIGLVAAVPLTTALAAFLAGRHREHDTN
jgi:uncharacterized membrane protein